MFPLIEYNDDNEYNYNLIKAFYLLQFTKIFFPKTNLYTLYICSLSALCIFKNTA